MALDAIVFEQAGLDTAISSGCRHIALCDNSFILSPIENISYTAIGKVHARISLPKSQTKNISFNGFIPEFVPELAYVPLKSEGFSFESYSSLGSFYGSFSGSFGSWSYGWGWGRGMSSGTSFGSFASSFSGSYNHIINPFIYIKGYGIDLI